MKVLSQAAFLTVAAVGCLALNTTGGSSDCRVQAWVRAEDLAPDTISHGDFRIKVAPAHCAHQIASVVLRLQLHEFGEVKHLRRGAVLPEIKPASNQTRPDFLSDPWFQAVSNDEILYDYAAYDAAMSDPAFWVVKAEERTAWTTEVTLFENNPDFSEPRVKPFVIVSPDVNYPPAAQNYRGWNGDPLRRHAFAKLGYYYVAVVNFTNGSSISLPAGHTNFLTTSTPVKTEHFRTNVTFAAQEINNEYWNLDLPNSKKIMSDRERCLPEALRSVFVAEVMLENGNAVQRGQTLKGKVAIHSTNGSTTMSSLSLTLEAAKNHHWAADQAATHGDEQFCATCVHSWDRVITVNDYDSSLFEQEENSQDVGFYDGSPSASASLTPNKPYIDFAVKIPENMVPSFSSYYSASEAVLSLQLDVGYPHEAAECIYGADKVQRETALYELSTFEETGNPGDMLADTEEGLWDSYTPVGKPRTAPSLWHHTLHLSARVPIVVLGTRSESAHPPEHYLNPGVPSPIILAFPEEVARASPLPPARPTIIEESFANTSSRLLRSGGSFDPIEQQRNFFRSSMSWNYSDPAVRAVGEYAGLLWKKKIVAMERGILPTEGESRGEDLNDSHGQKPFVVAP